MTNGGPGRFVLLADLLLYSVASCGNLFGYASRSPDAAVHRHLVMTCLQRRRPPERADERPAARPPGWLEVDGRMTASTAYLASSAWRPPRTVFARSVSSVWMVSTRSNTRPT